MGGIPQRQTIGPQVFPPSTTRKKARLAPGFFNSSKLNSNLKFLVEIAGRARDIDTAGDTSLAVFYALNDACGFAAFGTVGRLRRVHYLLAITCFCYFSHWLGGSPSGVVSAHTRKKARGFNGAVMSSVSFRKGIASASGQRFA